jgi:hypothetical protein
MTGSSELLELKPAKMTGLAEYLATKFCKNDKFSSVVSNKTLQR